MKIKGQHLKGFTVKVGKVVKITGYGLNASARIAQKKSKRIRPAKGKTR